MVPNWKEIHEGSSQSRVQQYPPAPADGVDRVPRRVRIDHPLRHVLGLPVLDVVFVMAGLFLPPVVAVVALVMLIGEARGTGAAG
jgi:hypothetical protein